jgi:hypothetical protein
MSPHAIPDADVDLMRKPPKSVEKRPPDVDSNEAGTPEPDDPPVTKTSWLAALGEELQP